MKKSIATIWIMLLLSVAAFTQSNFLYADVMTRGLTNYQSYFAGPALGFESVLKNKTTIGFKAGLLFADKAYDTPGRYRLRERLLVFQPEVKFYTNETFKGFYFGLHLNYQNYDQKLRDKRDDVTLRTVVTEISNGFFGAGIDLGFMTEINSRFSFGVGASADLLFDVSIFGEGELGIGLDARFGYRF